MALVAPRKEFLSDILITATEGGINYWSQLLSRKWEQPDRNILLAVRVQPIDDDWQPEGEAVLVDQAKLEGALALILDTRREFSVRGDIYQAIALGNRNNDAGEIDAEAADVIVQAACFGEIVYS